MVNTSSDVVRIMPDKKKKPNFLALFLFSPPICQKKRENLYFPQSLTRSKLLTIEYTECCLIHLGEKVELKKIRERVETGPR